MKTELLVVAISILPTFTWAQELPPVTQQKVNEAIERGVRYLRQTQSASGVWAAPNAFMQAKHQVSYAALPALALLECGIPADDPGIRRAATAVRNATPKLNTTYEIACSILFLDKLGDAKDEPFIQVLALRLIAGQTLTGGWTYTCPVLDRRTHSAFMTALQKSQPEVLFNPFGTKAGDMLSSSQSHAEVSPGEQSAKKETKKSAETALENAIRSLPVMQDQRDLGVFATKIEKPVFDATDNSNTQFAMLALWAARRHLVPTQRTLNLLTFRFTTSQNPDGSWSYRYRFGGDERGKPQMTSVGLLGLAIGHALAHDGAIKDPALVQNPRVTGGFASLARHVGDPGNPNMPVRNLYMLWSVERAAMLYRLPTIGGHDWYGWGVEALLANQTPAGNWTNGGYPGSGPTADTCLALLFLKKVNFSADLAAKLPFQAVELEKAISKQLSESSSNP